MPRDDWTKARAKNVARRADLRNYSSSRRSIIRSKAGRQRKIETGRLQSWSTILWFGPHKGKTVSQVNATNPAYIAKLATNPVPDKAWRMYLLVQFLKKITKHQYSPRNGHPAPAAVMRGNEAPATSIEGRGKSVARIGTSADVDFDQVFEAVRRDY